MTPASPLFQHTGDSELCVRSRPEPQHWGCFCCRPPQTVSPPPAASRPPQQSAGPHVAGSAEQQRHKGENEKRVISNCRTFVGKQRENAARGCCGCDEGYFIVSCERNLSWIKRTAASIRPNITGTTHQNTCLNSTSTLRLNFQVLPLK